MQLWSLCCHFVHFLLFCRNIESFCISSQSFSVSLWSFCTCFVSFFLFLSCFTENLCGFFAFCHFMSPRCHFVVFDVGFCPFLVILCLIVIIFVHVLCLFSVSLPLCAHLKSFCIHRWSLWSCQIGGTCHSVMLLQPAAAFCGSHVVLCSDGSPRAVEKPNRFVVS